MDWTEPVWFCRVKLDIIMNYSTYKVLQFIFKYNTSFVFVFTYNTSSVVLFVYTRCSVRIYRGSIIKTPVWETNIVNMSKLRFLQGVFHQYLLQALLRFLYQKSLTTILFYCFMNFIVYTLVFSILPLTLQMYFEQYYSWIKQIYSSFD